MNIAITQQHWIYLLAFLPGYLDPGTGSYVLQVLIAALVGLAFIIKTYWARIKHGIQKLFHRETINLEDED